MPITHSILRPRIIIDTRENPYMSVENFEDLLRGNEKLIRANDISIDLNNITINHNSKKFFKLSKDLKKIFKQ